MYTKKATSGLQGRRNKSCPDLCGIRPASAPVRKTSSVNVFGTEMIIHELVMSPVVTVFQCHLKTGIPVSDDEMKDLAACVLAPDEINREPPPIFVAQKTVMERLEEDEVFRQRYVDWCARIRRQRRPPALPVAE